METPGVSRFQCISGPVGDNCCLGFCCVAVRDWHKVRFIMIKLLMRILLQTYNVVVFVGINVVMFVNHLWRPRRWTRPAVPLQFHDDTR